MTGPEELRPWAVVLPSFSGGWLSLAPLSAPELRFFAERYDYRPALPGGGPLVPTDFQGCLTLHLPERVKAVPVVWTREVQLSFVTFLDSIQRATHTFPQARSFQDPTGACTADAEIYVVPAQVAIYRQRARIEVRLCSALDGDEALGELVVPAPACTDAAIWCCDLFPGLDRDDWDRIRR